MQTGSAVLPEENNLKAAHFHGAARIDAANRRHTEITLYRMKVNNSTAKHSL